MALEENYEITMDWEGKKYACINIKWDYPLVHKNCKGRLSMEDYIKDLLSKVAHTKPIKSQLLPQLHNPIVFWSTKQFTADIDTSAPLYAKSILRVKKNVRVLLYYGRAVDKKLMFVLDRVQDSHEEQ